MAKTFAIIFGIVFVVVSLLAFIPNPIVGPSGFFVTNNIHDIIHLLFGIILLIAAGAGESASALWLKISGVIYLILFIDGLIQPTALLGFVTANGADTWLHLVLGIALLAAGYMGKPKMEGSMAM